MMQNKPDARDGLQPRVIRDVGHRIGYKIRDGL